MDSYSCSIVASLYAQSTRLPQRYVCDETQTKHDDVGEDEIDDPFSEWATVIPRDREREQHKGVA